MLSLEALHIELAEQGPNAATYMNIIMSWVRVHEIIDQLTNFPQDTLFLGLGIDGLPLILNLADPTPGPVLLVADNTNFLQNIAATLDGHQDQNLSYVAFTPFTHQWSGLEVQAGSNYVVPSDQTKTVVSYLSSLVEWQSVKLAESKLLLLIDDLPAMISGLPTDARNSLLHLLYTGPDNGIWPIATGTPTELVNPAYRSYLGMFHTRIFGQHKITSPDDPIRALAPPIDARELEKFAPYQFVVNKRNTPLQFWLPGND